MEKKCATPIRRTPSSDKARSKSCCCCRKVLALALSPFGFTLLIAGYICFGAYLFRSLEAPLERHRSAQVISLRNFTVHKLWNITEKFNILYKENWTSMVMKELVLYQQQLVDAVKDGYGNTREDTPQWNFGASFLYSLSIITTIGKLLSRADMYSHTLQYMLDTSKSR